MLNTVSGVSNRLDEDVSRQDTGYPDQSKADRGLGIQFVLDCIKFKFTTEVHSWIQA